MCPVGCGAQMTRLDFPIVVRRSHFALRAGAGSSGIGPVRSDMKTGDHAGPDRCPGTNSRTRSAPAGYRTFLLNFARPDGDLPRICARKISAPRGDTNGSSLRWDISRHSSDLHPHDRCRLSMPLRTPAKRRRNCRRAVRVNDFRRSREAAQFRAARLEGSRPG